MKREIARTARLTFKCRKRTRREDGAYVYVEDGTVSAVAVLDVDAERLLQRMAERAIRSKGGKAVLGGGLVVVRALNRSRGDGASCPKCGERDAPLKWDNGKCWTCGYCSDEGGGP